MRIATAFFPWTALVVFPVTHVLAFQDWQFVNYTGLEPKPQTSATRREIVFYIVDPNYADHQRDPPGPESASGGGTTSDGPGSYSKARFELTWDLSQPIPYSLNFDVNPDMGDRRTWSVTFNKADDPIPGHQLPENSPVANFEIILQCVYPADVGLGTWVGYHNFTLAQNLQLLTDPPHYLPGDKNWIFTLQDAAKDGVAISAIRTNI